MLRQNWRFKLRYCVADCTFHYVHHAKVKSLELTHQPIRWSFVIFNTHIINTQCVELRASCSVTEIIRPCDVSSQKTVILVFSTLRLTNAYVWNIWILLLSFDRDRQQRDCITVFVNFLYRRTKLQNCSYSFKKWILSLQLLM